MDEFEARDGAVPDLDPETVCLLLLAALAFRV
jgi:hypothetical protein